MQELSITSSLNIESHLEIGEDDLALPRRRAKIFNCLVHHISWHGFWSKILKIIGLTQSLLGVEWSWAFCEANCPLPIQPCSTWTTCDLRLSHNKIHCTTSCTHPVHFLRLFKVFFIWYQNYQKYIETINSNRNYFSENWKIMIIYNKCCILSFVIEISINMRDFPLSLPSYRGWSSYRP